MFTRGLLVALSVDVRYRGGAADFEDGGAPYSGVSYACGRQMICSGQLCRRNQGRDNYVPFPGASEQYAEPAPAQERPASRSVAGRRLRSAGGLWTPTVRQERSPGPMARAGPSPYDLRGFRPRSVPPTVRVACAAALPLASEGLHAQPSWPPALPARYRRELQHHAHVLDRYHRLRRVLRIMSAAVCSTALCVPISGRVYAASICRRDQPRSRRYPGLRPENARSPAQGCYFKALCWRILHA